MDIYSANELLEAASIGDLDQIKKLLNSGVSINYQHSINKWSALHWACKRDYPHIIKLLLDHGADDNLLTSSGETCWQLKIKSDDGFIPNYINYPIFPYTNSSKENTIKLNDFNSNKDSFRYQSINSTNILPENELILKIRKENDLDFIEIELSTKDLTFENLVTTITSELKINESDIKKIRKLPNTIIRRTKEVKRLQHYQELEVTLKS